MSGFTHEDGKIHIMHEVRCAQCFATDIVSGPKKYAIGEYKKSGWKKTKAGWICPKHETKAGL